MAEEMLQKSWMQYFELQKLSAAGVFTHQSCVSCTLRAGLATCTVLDIRRYSTIIARAENGSILSD